ncbi:MAG: hypothetical protein V8Q88_10155 [Christensenellales bacterium]
MGHLFKACAVHKPFSHESLFPFAERVENPFQRFPIADLFGQRVNGRHQPFIRNGRPAIQRHVPLLPSAIGVDLRQQPMAAGFKQPRLDIRRVFQPVIFFAGFQKRLLNAVIHHIAVFRPMLHPVEARAFQLHRVLRVKPFDKRLFFPLHRRSRSVFRLLSV